MHQGAPRRGRVGGGPHFNARTAHTRFAAMLRNRRLAVCVGFFWFPAGPSVVRLAIAPNGGSAHPLRRPSHTILPFWWWKVNTARPCSRRWGNWGVVVVSVHVKESRCSQAGAESAEARKRGDHNYQNVPMREGRGRVTTSGASSPRAMPSLSHNKREGG